MLTAEEGFDALVNSFASQQRENEKLRQEIELLKIKIREKNEKMKLQEEDNLHVAQFCADMRDSIDKLKTERDMLKIRLQSEQSQNCRLSITLKSIENTVREKTIQEEHERDFQTLEYDIFTKACEKNISDLETLRKRLKRDNSAEDDHRDRLATHYEEHDGEEAAAMSNPIPIAVNNKDLDV